MTIPGNILQKPIGGFGSGFLSWVLRKMTNGLVKSSTGMYTQLVGFYAVIRESNYASKTAMDDYNRFKKIVESIISLNEKYNSIDYADNDELRKIMNDLLFIAYDIEAELKVQAYSGKTSIPADIDYKVALSAKSHHSLHKKLSSEIG